MAESAAQNATVSDTTPVERAGQLLEPIARSLRAQFGGRIDDSVIVAAPAARRLSGNGTISCAPADSG